MLFSTSSEAITITKTVATQATKKVAFTKPEPPNNLMMYCYKRFAKINTERNAS